VLFGRFPEGEAIIASSPTYAYLYAKNTLKRRWLEAEATILSDSIPSQNYADIFNLDIIRKFKERN
jgi:hypothetical protein